LLRLVLLIILPLSAVSAHAETLVERAQAAEDLYRAGDFQAAAAAYTTLLEAGIENSGLLVNLANSHFKLAQYTQALAYYRRAKLLNPRAEDIELGIARAREKLARPEKEVTPSWHTALLSILSRAELQTLSLVLVCISCLLLIAQTRVTLSWLTPLITIGFIASCASVVLALLLWSNVQGSPTLSVFKVHHAVVKEKNTIVFSGPQPDTPQVAVLALGEEVGISSLTEEWAQLILERNRVGWVEREKLLAIDYEDER